jgi:hypothetical protein
MEVDRLLHAGVRLDRRDELPERDRTIAVMVELHQKNLCVLVRHAQIGQHLHKLSNVDFVGTIRVILRELPGDFRHGDLAVEVMVNQPLQL